MTTPPMFAGSLHDRAAHERKDHDALAVAVADSDSRLLPVWKGRPLVDVSSGRGQPARLAWLDSAAAGERIAGVPWVFLGRVDEQRAFALDWTGLEGVDTDPALRAHGKFVDLRSVATQLSAGEPGLVAEARSLLHWHAKHGFCAACGAASRVIEGGWKRTCDACSTEHFPRTDPVVIMLVHDGDYVLVGRQPRFPPRFFSCLAGFVEPGESLEEAVAREVLEEAGVAVADVTYYASQPWPYPSSLMIGCYARALGRAITLDPDELEEARWVSRADLRLALAGKNREFFVPPPLAIAHHLLRSWAEQEG